MNNMYQYNYSLLGRYLQFVYHSNCINSVAASINIRINDIISILVQKMRTKAVDLCAEMSQIVFKYTKAYVYSCKIALFTGVCICLCPYPPSWNV